MKQGKNKLLDWVDEQVLDLPLRWVLEKFASFADPERFAWAPVPWLVKVSGLSERKIRYLIRDLEAMRLIEKTDRLHRLEGSTRSVPVYRIAPQEEAFADEPMGAPRAPMPPPADRPKDLGMGARGAPMAEGYPTGTLDTHHTYVAPPLDIRELDGGAADVNDLIHITTELMKHGAGEEWKYQANALPLWKRPKLLVKLSAAAS